LNRFTILVDAGYLMRQAIEILSNKTNSSRANLSLVDPKGLIQMLIQKASSTLNNNQLLRVYWYDGVGTSLTPEHKSIIALDDVQMRAGTINGKGQQKGVDSRIVTDLIELATNHAISDAMLVTGDGDLAIGIELAQRRGVRVAVLGVEELTVGVHHSQSSEVTNIADRVVRLGLSDISPYITYLIPTPPVPITSKAKANIPAVATLTPTPTAPTLDLVAIENAVIAFISAQTPALTKAAVTSTGSIESAVDRLLLFSVMNSLGGNKLSPQQKNSTRLTFRNKIQSIP